MMESLYFQTTGPYERAEVLACREKRHAEISGELDKLLAQLEEFDEGQRLV